MNACNVVNVRYLVFHHRQPLANNRQFDCHDLFGFHCQPATRSYFILLYFSPTNLSTEEEVKEYFQPSDFRIGHSLNILGRKFLIYDCDNFTKAWYYQNFGLTDFTPVDVDIKVPEIPKKVGCSPCICYHWRFYTGLKFQ